MNKIAIPAILVATIMVAGMFAFMPVEQASTVHLSGTITTTSTADTTQVLVDTTAILLDTDAMEPQITAARMEELDAVNLPADIDAILLDTDAMEPQITAARMEELDAGNLPLDIDAILLDTGTSLVIGASDTTIGTGTLSIAEGAGTTDADDDPDNDVSDAIGGYYVSYTWQDSTATNWEDGVDTITLTIADAATGATLCTGTEIPVGTADENFVLTCNFAADTFVDYTISIIDISDVTVVTVDVINVTLTKVSQTG